MMERERIMGIEDLAREEFARGEDPVEVFHRHKRLWPMQRRSFLAGWLGIAGVARAQSAPLYLLTYDHGGLVLWGIDHFVERLRDAVAWLDRYPGFKIGLDNEAYTYDYLAEHDPKVLAELRHVLARHPGRFGIGSCTYGQPLSTFINEESNIRQIASALEIDRRHFGSAPEIYLMSEHAMHSQMPQILAGLGFKGAIMRTHFMMYGYNPTFDAPVGWWIGPDGSRVATVPTYPGEGAEFGRTTTDNWILTRCPGPECRGGSLEQFRSQFAHIHPLVATRADDSGLRREALVRETEGRPEYRWILLEDLPGVLPKPTAEFKTGPNDFTVRMPWGYCGNEIWNRSRRAEIAVLTAERMAAVELLTGGENREADQERAWKNLLVGQHHDIQICGLLPDARRFLNASLESSERVTAASLKYAATRMHGGKTAQVTIFNPRSWSSPEWVEAEFTLPRRWAKAVKVLHQAQEVPAVLLSALRGSDESIQQARVAIRTDVPPLGFASYEVAPAEGPGTSRPQPYWNLEFASGGGIEAVASRASGKVLLREARFAATVDGKRCVSEGQWRKLAAPAGAPWIKSCEEGSIGGIPYRLCVTAWTDSPRLDFQVTFEFDNQRVGLLSEDRRDARSPFIHEEKLRFKFIPAAGPGAIGVRDLPFMVAETPARYIEGNYWTALTDGRAGVAVFNRGTMGTVREADGGLSIPLAYSMYYVWGTRILSGEYGFEFALYPFEGPWAEAGLHRRALEYNFPCVAVAGEPGDGSLGGTVALFDIASENVVVSALYTKQVAAYLRLYEYQGRPASVALRYSGGRGRFTETDLRGTAGAAVASPLRFRPWQLRTLRLGV
jgi:alpha-mannosidase